MQIELFIFARNFYMKKLILFISFICITITSKAQMYEIGVFGGGSNYIGDIGSEYYINPNNLMGGVVFKWNINPRIALRGNFNYAQISDSDANSTNNARKQRNLTFTNNIKELAVGIEYSFFEYNIDEIDQKQTPYLLFQLAAINYRSIAEGSTPARYNYIYKTTMSIPFGVGYKTRIARNFAMAFEIRAAYTFTDHLDDNIKSISTPNFGNPNNNDWYMFTAISFVYAFGRPPCYTTPY